MTYCLWFFLTWVLAFGSRFVSLMVLGTVVSFKSLSDSRSSAKDRNTTSEINSNIHDATSIAWLLSTGIERYFPALKSGSSVSDQETSSRKRKARSFPAFHNVFLFWVSFDWFLALLVFSVIDYMAATHARLTLFHYIIWWKITLSPVSQFAHPPVFIIDVKHTDDITRLNGELVRSIGVIWIHSYNLLYGKDKEQIHLVYLGYSCHSKTPY